MVLFRCLLIAFLVMPVAVHAESMRIALDSNDSVDLKLTVYNDNFAVVRDAREMVLPGGTYELEYQGISESVDPTTVTVTSSKTGLSIIEQNYRFDLLSRSALLEKFIGRKLKYSRSVLHDGAYEKVLREGTLLSSNPEVVRFGDVIEIDPEGTISLPYLPEDMSMKPSLLWLLENKLAGKQTILTTYVTGDVSWSADHVATLSEDESSMDVTTWVTVRNESGIDYSNASLQLIAGTVNRVASPAPVTPRMVGRMDFQMAEMSASALPVEESFFEYHRYTIPGRTTLQNRQLKQLKLMETSGLVVTKRYVLKSDVMRHQAGETQKQRFDVALEFTSDTEQPFPAGRMRVFAEEVGGAPQLIGEDMLAHTPTDEGVSVTVGKAFDLSAERTQTSYRRVGDRAMDIEYRIDVANHKSEAVTVRLQEKVAGNWRLLKETVDSVKVDSTTFQYDLDLGRNDEATVTYSVRLSW
jgi:hypothetical protein